MNWYDMMGRFTVGFEDVQITQPVPLFLFSRLKEGSVWYTHG